MLALTLAATGAAAQPATAGPEVKPDPDVPECFRLRHGDPPAALALARRRIAAGDLARHDLVAMRSCEAVTSALAGDRPATRAAIAEVDRLMAQGPLPPGYAMRAHSNAGATLQLLGDIPGALERQQRALEVADAEDAPAAQVSTLVNIAIVNSEDLGANAEAEALYARAAAIADAAGQRNPVISYNRGINLARLGRDDDARARFEESLALAESGGEQLVAMRTTAELVGIDARPGGAPALAALAERQQAAQDVSGAARTMLVAARRTLRLGDARTAGADARRGRALLPDGTFQALSEELMAVEVQALGASGDWRGAHDALAALHGREAARLRTYQLDAIARLQATFHDLRQQDELARLRERQAIDSLEVRHERRLRNLALGAVALLLVLGAGFVVYQRRITRRLRLLSTQDALTGLLNRRAASRRMRGAAQAQGGTGRRGVVFLIDIDRFKAINDVHGHAAGDAVITAVSDALRAGCRPDDVVARWGGEEFLVGCHGLGRQQATELVERLGRSAASAGEAIGRPLTVSIGFAAFPLFSGGHDDWSDAVGLADRALYAAKRGGRDAWAGFWGSDAAGSDADADADAAAEDPALAVAEGRLEWLASRPGIRLDD